MGRLLEEYIASNVPALENIVRGGIQQPEGATTFPMPAEQPMQGQPIGPGGAPTGPMAAIPGPGGLNPQAAATPSFEGAPVGPQPAMPPVEGQQQPDRSGEFEAGPDSFAGMSNDADPKDIDNATKAMEEGGVDIDEEYAKVTGSKPEESEDDPEGKTKGEGLTRQEKALILMEFGLNLMAQSGTGEGTFAGDIGKAGGAALGGHMTRKAARQKMLIEAEDRKLDRELKRAKITKAQTPTATIKTDQSGNYISISEGVSTPILDVEGNAVSAENVERFAAQIEREAYEELECEGLSGSALKTCKRRALAFSAGGAARVAFPELEAAEQVQAVRDDLENPDRKSHRYHVPSTGTKIKWKDMTPEQQDEVAENKVAKRMELIRRYSTQGGAANGKAPEKAPAKDPTGIMAQLSPEDRANIKPGKIYTLKDGREFKLVDGVIQIVE